MKDLIQWSINLSEDPSRTAVLLLLFLVIILTKYNFFSHFVTLKQVHTKNIKLLYLSYDRKQKQFRLNWRLIVANIEVPDSQLILGVPSKYQETTLWDLACQMFQSRRENLLSQNHVVYQTVKYDLSQAGLKFTTSPEEGKMVAIASRC